MQAWIFIAHARLVPRSSTARTVTARDPAPAQDIGASYSKLPDAVRIALLPLRTVRQGLKRLQEQVQKRERECAQQRGRRSFQAQSRAHA
jgi:hypothetical protein